MGCGASTYGDGSNSAGFSEEGSYSASVTRQWKVLPSQQEARLSYLNDGTMVEESSVGLLELRALLDYPVAHPIILKYYTEMNMLNEVEYLNCWVDIQEFKKTKFEKVLRDNALKLYSKYVTKFERLDAIKVAEVKEDLSPSVKGLHHMPIEEEHATINVSMFDWLQVVMLERLSGTFQRFKSHEYHEQLSKVLRRKYNNIKSSDFEYYEVLGEGGFGLVVHVRKKSTNKHYALKVQTKERVFEMNYEHPWRADYEKQAFASCHHPFIIQLFYAFQTKSLIMLVMSLGSGVDLSKVLKRLGRLPIERTKFYCAEIASALIYVHKKGMLYRDLKPGNVLLNDDGHICLVDLGAVADVQSKTLTSDTDGASPKPTALPVFAKKFGSVDTEAKSTLIAKAMADGTFVAPTLGDAAGDSDDMDVPPKRALSILGTLGYMVSEANVLYADKALSIKYLSLYLELNFILFVP